MESEQRYFKTLEKSLSESPEILMSALLSWYDSFREGRYGPALESFVCASGDPELRHKLSELEGIVYGGSDRNDWNGLELVEHFRLARKISNAVHGPLHSRKLEAMNPENEPMLKCSTRE